MKVHGHVVGSSSDRTLREQQAMWDRHGIAVKFVGHKHKLATLRARFACDRFIHVGDTDVDRRYAEEAGFEFVSVHDVKHAAVDIQELISHRVLSSFGTARPSTPSCVPRGAGGLEQVDSGDRSTH
jgi:hypothetical protein